MNITFRQLQVFLALAEHKSVTAAARACHITQPTVSMQLKDLNDAVGLPLYEQVGKRLSLTAAGEALVDTARAMSDEWACFEQTIEGMKGHTKGRLRVAVASTAKYFIPRILGTFCAKYPEIDIALQVLNRDGVVARLRDNADDLCIMSIPPEDLDLQRHAFLPNPLVMIASATHRMGGKRKLALKDLADEAFILREPGSGTRLACNAHFVRYRFHPKIRLELGSNEAIKQAVAGNLGIAVVSRHSLPARPEDDALTILRIDDFPIHSNWWVLYPNGKRLSPIASVFLEH
ncbi:MAG: transcriptional regulator, LysR family, partial [Paucimonas sp.]|nr:transcriptional regulator, LysR family [Paucimonas sp.]